MTPTKLAYSIPEAAQAAGVSVDIIRRAVRTGRLVPRYMSARGVILADELRAWIEDAPTVRKQDTA